MRSAYTSVFSNLSCEKGAAGSVMRWNSGPLFALPHPIMLSRTPPKFGPNLRIPKRLYPRNCPDREYFLVVLSMILNVDL